MIRIRSLTKRYADGRQALHGVDLDIEDGLFGIVGPNGAGKTTLLSILVLALAPSGGTLEYGGLDPRRPRDRAAIRRRIGYLPQDFSPIRRLTGREYLVHCGSLRRPGLSTREMRRRADELLEAVSLTDVANRKCGTYSGGMRRRLGFAQALIHMPTLLVVDEPTSGLDPEERIRFRNLIAEIAERTAVLLSTHIIEDVEATCPRLGIIADGRVLFDGPPGEIVTSARDRLWELPGGEVESTGLPVVARRVDGQGKASVVVHSESVVAGARRVTATLEMAYSAFLALRGTPVLEDASA